MGFWKTERGKGGGGLGGIMGGGGGVGVRGGGATFTGGGAVTANDGADEATGDVKLVLSAMAC